MKYFFHIVLFFGFCAYGQSEPSPGYLGQVGIVFKDVPIEGSPYFDDIFKIGTTTVNGREVRLLMRFNALNDQIELKDVRQKEFNLLRRKDLIADFGGRKYLLLAYEDNFKVKEGYFIPLNEGNAVLFYKPKKEFIQARHPDHGYDTYKPPVYQDASGYFIKIADGPLTPIRLAKGPLLKFLDDRSGKLKHFIRENELDFSSDLAVIQILDHFNTGL